MNGSFLLVTNIVIALFAGEVGIQRHLARDPSVFVASVVVGEMYYGALASGRKESNIQRIQDFARVVTVLACDAGTALSYGEVKSRLRQKGRPIPENDVWIAAIALQHGLTLVSRDPHFNEVEGLLQESW